MPGAAGSSPASMIQPLRSESSSSASHLLGSARIASTAAGSSARVIPPGPHQERSVSKIMPADVHRWMQKHQNRGWRGSRVGSNRKTRPLPSTLKERPSPSPPRDVRIVSRSPSCELTSTARASVGAEIDDVESGIAATFRAEALGPPYPRGEKRSPWEDRYCCRTSTAPLSITEELSVA